MHPVASSVMIAETLNNVIINYLKLAAHTRHAGMFKLIAT